MEESKNNNLEEKIEDWSMFGKNPQHTAYVNIELNPHKLVLIRLGKKMLSYKESGRSFLVFKDNVIQRANGFPPSAILNSIEVSASWDSITAINTKNQEKLWEHSTPKGGLRHIGGYTPIISREKVYLAVHGSGLRTFDLYSGKEEWRFIAKDKSSDRGWYTSPAPAVANNRIYVGSLETGTWSQSLNYWLHCLDANTGKEIWRYRTWGYCGIAQPVVTNNIVILGSNSLYFLDSKTGKKKRKIKFVSPFSHEYINSVIMVGKKIYFDTNDNYLYVVKENEK